jgi:hypothetical protein
MIFYGLPRVVSNTVKCIYSLGLVSKAQLAAAAAPGVPALVLLFIQCSSHVIQDSIISDVCQIASETISARQKITISARDSLQSKGFWAVSVKWGIKIVIKLL